MLALMSFVLGCIVGAVGTLVLALYFHPKEKAQ
jgi:hypothetical protein